MLYEQLLRVQMKKAQNTLIDCLCALVGSLRVKAALKHVGEIDPRSEL